MRLPIGIIGILLLVALASARTPNRFDMFKKLACSDEVARLDNYGTELRKLPNTLAVIVVYGGRTDTRPGEVFARLFGIRDHLVKKNSIGSDRVIILNGGSRERLEIELWIMPSEPRGDFSLLLNPTVESKDVRLKSGFVRTWKYRCKVE
jgi:hypothetical protein